MEGFFYGIESCEGQAWPLRMARFNTREALNAWLAHPKQRYDTDTGKLITENGFKRFVHDACPIMEDAARYLQIRRISEWDRSKSPGDQDGMFLWMCR